MATATKIRKPKITARKHNGDDAYSWAVFRDGRVVFAGLSRAQVPYYKEQALKGYKDAFLVP